MTDPSVASPAEREELIRDAFARVTAAPDAAYDDALADAADLVAAHGRALAAELAATSATLGRDQDPEFATRSTADLDAFWQRQMLRTFEIIDGQRLMGRIADKDEVYRILIIDHRLASRARALLAARGWDQRFVSDVRRFHDELLFSVSPSTPPGALLPSSPDVEPDPFDDGRALATGVRRTRAIDRVRAAEDAWAEVLGQRSDGERGDIDRALKLDKKEHKRALQLADWGVRAGVLAENERDGIVSALGRYSKETDGWPDGTEVARKAAVSEAIATLHDLFSALS